MIFFDIDETLIQNNAAERRAAEAFYLRYRELLQEPLDRFLWRWKALTLQNVQRYLAGELSFQEQRRERIRQVFKGRRSLGGPEADAVFDFYLKAYEASWAIYPDALVFLEELGDAGLGIVSNGDAVQQRQKLESLGIAERFEVILISGDRGVSKPDPQIFVDACRAAGRKPSRCWHVGDDLEADYGGSTAAGLSGIWLNRGDRKRIDGIPTIGSLSELKAIVDDAIGC
jgi:putative hydrolase of the HAD superfamily